MGEIRTPKKTLEKIIEVSKETSPFLALAGAIEIIEDYPRYEEKVPVKFDCNTGKPLEFSWKPNKDLIPLKIGLGYDKKHQEKGRYVAFDINQGSIPINQKVIDYLLFDLHIEKKPFIIHISRGDYIVGYNEESYEAHGQNDSWTQTDREIYIKKLSGILMKEGIKPIKLTGG